MIILILPVAIFSILIKIYLYKKENDLSDGRSNDSGEYTYDYLLVSYNIIVLFILICNSLCSMNTFYQLYKIKGTKTLKDLCPKIKLLNFGCPSLLKWTTSTSTLPTSTSTSTSSHVGAVDKNSSHSHSHSHHHPHRHSNEISHRNTSNTNTTKTTSSSTSSSTSTNDEAKAYPLFVLAYRLAFYPIVFVVLHIPISIYQITYQSTTAGYIPNVRNVI
jgi:hypothetical protein